MEFNMLGSEASYFWTPYATATWRLGRLRNWLLCLPEHMVICQPSTGDPSTQVLIVGRLENIISGH